MGGNFSCPFWREFPLEHVLENLENDYIKPSNLILLTGKEGWRDGGTDGWISLLEHIRLLSSLIIGRPEVILWCCEVFFPGTISVCSAPCSRFRLCLFDTWSSEWLETLSDVYLSQWNTKGFGCCMHAAYSMTFLIRIIRMRRPRCYPAVLPEGRYVNSIQPEALQCARINEIIA